MVLISAVVLCILVFAARLPRRSLVFALALLVLVAIQIVLAWAAESHAWVGPFHAIVAFFVLGVAGGLAMRAQRGFDPPGAAA